jgi:ankyrin repeat protein
MHLLWFAVLILYFKCVYSDDTADDRAKGKKSDIEPNERLFRGIIANDYDEVKRSIVLGASVNIQIGKEGHTPFIWASFYGYLNIMQLLLKHGADIEGISGDGQKTALLLASYNNKVEAVEYLLKRGANIEARNDRGDSGNIIIFH